MASINITPCGQLDQGFEASEDDSFPGATQEMTTHRVRQYSTRGSWAVKPHP